MKKTIINVSILIAFTSILIIGCKKKDTSTPDETPAPVTTGTPQATGSFTWTENGGAVNTADSAYWTTGTWGTGLRAYKGGMTNFFEINWATQNNTTVGSKTIDFANYGFTFLKGSESYGISSNQNLAVSAFSSDQLSGNFTMSVTGGTITSIVAGFSTLAKK